ncbi:hypothetical protein AXX17_AT3G04370 [Arabidopsis thaliana]|uniref:Uncharacterized protein n=2 Tax=Arabidopsis TaxID=3701 RepID=A0A178V739_ARATH|nr:hypothetical protein AXX17_AT3G04370 [Arabidopsis thaliana]
MAGVACQISISSSSTLRRVNQWPRCFSGSPEKKTPAVLKWAVSGVTEFLRLISGAPSSTSIATNKDR